MSPEEIESQKPNVPKFTPEQITDLDVRPILKSGGEPFSAIMAAVESIPQNGALRLRATFKPTPLFHVLGKQGWQHAIEHGEADDWTILFYRASQPGDVSTASAVEMRIAHLQKDNPELQKRLKIDGDTWFLDVCTLAPPEPMELTLSVLNQLPRQAALVQINERVPQFLLPILEERGFHFELTHGEKVELKITHA